MVMPSGEFASALHKLVRRSLSRRDFRAEKSFRFHITSAHFPRHCRLFLRCRWQNADGSFNQMRKDAHSLPPRPASCELKTLVLIKSKKLHKPLKSFRAKILLLPPRELFSIIRNHNLWGLSHRWGFVFFSSAAWGNISWFCGGEASVEWNRSHRLLCCCVFFTRHPPTLECK